MPAEKALETLFPVMLNEICFAERQTLRARPQMKRAARSEEGKAGFLQYRDETQCQVNLLEQLLEPMGKPVRGKTCEAIQDILSEGEEVMEEDKHSSMPDFGPVASAQAVELSETARYGTLKASARRSDPTLAVALLDAKLQDKIATVHMLTALGEASENPKGSDRKAG